MARVFAVRVQIAGRIGVSRYKVLDVQVVSQGTQSLSESSSSRLTATEPNNCLDTRN